jgi:hypothetical protein
LRQMGSIQNIEANFSPKHVIFVFLERAYYNN